MTKWTILPTMLLALLAGHAVHAGGGWTEARGHGYAKLSQNMIRATRYFAPDGSVVDITTTSVYVTNLYGEVGISDRLTGLLYFPFFVRSTINERQSAINGAVEPGDDLNGIGDPEIGIKYGLIKDGPVVMAATLWLHLPAGNNVGGNTELLQTGDGAFSQRIRIDASTSFHPAPFYASLGVAFNHRGTTTYSYRLGDEEVDYSDEMRWGGEVGWTPGDHWLVNVKWLHVISLRNGTANGETGSSSIFGNNISYFSVTPEVNYIFGKGWGVSLAVGTALYGENILADPNYNLGVFCTW